MGYYLHIIRKKSYAEWEETSNLPGRMEVVETLVDEPSPVKKPQ